MTRQTDHHEAGSRRLLPALAALGALVLLFVAVPVALVALTQALPVDLGSLSPAAYGRPDDGRLLLVAILAVAWAAWAVTMLSVGLETWAAIRRLPTPRLPGMAMPQRLAAVLVTAVLVALSPAAGGPAVGTGMAAGASEAVGASVRAESVGAQAVGARAVGARAVGTNAVGTEVVGWDASLGAARADAEGARRIEDVGGRERSRGSRSGGWSFDRSTSQPAAPTLTTERHDTLWMLAEQYLGAGERYLEIIDLNRGVAQPDGRSLGDDGRLYPGWTLALPADASVVEPRPERHRVVRGDTLWQIAEDEWGDPTRYPEIAEANRGDLQPDGRRLADPDLIIPGWILEIPGNAGSTSPDAHGADPAADPVAEPGTGPAADLGAGPAADLGAPIDRALVGSASPLAAPARTATPVPPVAAEGLPALDRGMVAGTSAGESRANTATASPSLTSSPTVSASPIVSGSPTSSASPSTSGSSTASTTGQGATSPPSTSSDDDPIGQHSEAGGAAVALPAGGAVAALLLAGVGAELVRRRRQFQRHRRPGERMPDLGPGAQQVERAVRTAGHEPGLDLLDRVLVQLADEAEAEGLALPDVRLVRVTADSVALDLAASASTAIAPFVAADDTRWVLSRQLLATELPDRPRALPGLVTLGFAGPETLLLNLESVGTLAISGSTEVTADVLRGLAADLAFGPASALTERTLCLSDPSISEAVEAGGIGVEPDPVRAAATLATVLAGPARRAPVVPDAKDPLAADPLAADPLVIVLSDQYLDVRVPARSGCALVTTASIVAAGATLVIHDSGTAVLLPEREHLAPQRLSRTATRDVIEALSAADLPETDPPSGPSLAGVAQALAAESVSDRTEVPTGQAGLWEPPPSVPKVIDLREDAPVSALTVEPRRLEEQRLLPVDPGTGADRAGEAVHGESEDGPSGHVPGHPVATVPRVLVLGEVLVENAHGRCESTRIGRLAETAAFVLLNPGSRPSELQGALWPGRRSNPQTCRQMISRARTWLGRTDAGEPYLMTFAETGGRLRLRNEVGSDWADFQQLAAHGLADPEDTENLTAALALVRGRPFGAVASRELPWADLHINEMICLITDVAHALAERHERAGRQRAARDAALRGLRTESESEVLEAIVARIGL
jgi:nucleoid-associated protein YgaU